MKKRIFDIVLTVLVIAVLLPVRVLAANTNNEIQITDQGTVTMTSQNAAKEGITSLQVSLLVQPAVENAKVSFVFSDSAAKVAEFRYHEDSGLLNIYLSGTKALFADSDTLSLGTVVVQNQDGKDVMATVSVEKESLKYVYGTELVTEDAEISESPVTINADQSTTPDDGNDDASKSEAFKDLQETLKNAESYVAGNYTNESYQTMKKAMEEAKAVLNSSMPTEEELVNALQNLQNAMGALIPSNNDSKTDSDNGGSGNESNSNSGTDSNPESNGENKENDASVKTGDNVNILPFAGLLLISGLGLGYSCVSLRKKGSE